MGMEVGPTMLTVLDDAGALKTADLDDLLQNMLKPLDTRRDGLRRKVEEFTPEVKSLRARTRGIEKELQEREEGKHTRIAAAGPTSRARSTSTRKNSAGGHVGIMWQVDASNKVECVMGLH